MVTNCTYVSYGNFNHQLSNSSPPFDFSSCLHYITHSPPKMRLEYGDNICLIVYNCTPVSLTPLILIRPKIPTIHTYPIHLPKIHPSRKQQSKKKIKIKNSQNPFLCSATFNHSPEMFFPVENTKKAAHAIRSIYH